MMMPDPDAVARSELPGLLAVVERWAGLRPPDAPEPAGDEAEGRRTAGPPEQTAERGGSVLHWRGRLPERRRPDAPSPAPLDARPPPGPTSATGLAGSAGAHDDARAPGGRGSDAPAHHAPPQSADRPPGAPVRTESAGRAADEHGGGAAAVLADAPAAGAAFTAPTGASAPTPAPAPPALRAAQRTTPAAEVAPRPPRGARPLLDAVPVDVTSGEPARPATAPLPGLVALRSPVTSDPVVREPRVDHHRESMSAPAAAHAGTDPALPESAGDLEERLADVLEAAVLEAGIDLS